MKKKKKLLIIIFVLCLIIGAIAGNIAWYELNGYSCGKSILLSDITDKTDITLIGHRGMAALAPENTLPSFRLSAEMGCDGSECDVHTTSDGQWVIMHDDNVNRLTNGKGDIADKTLAEMQALKFTHGNKRKNYDETELYTPTLQEYLALLNEYDTIPVIELKNIDVNLLPDFVDILREYGVYDTAIVISFTYDYLTAIHSLAPDITLYYLTSKITDEQIQQCLALGCGIDFDGDRSCNNKYISECIENDIPVAAWTIDSPKRLCNLYDLGVRVFTSNCIHR